jgi:uncharacterized protein (DUF4415 family)
MIPHPTEQTKRERSDTWMMIDAFRKVETDLHHRLLEMRTIPPTGTASTSGGGSGTRSAMKVTAAFDADVVRFFKGLGPGYQWRMNEVLRAYVHGRMAKIVKGPDTTDYILHPERIPEEPDFVEVGAGGGLARTAAPAREPAGGAGRGGDQGARGEAARDDGGAGAGEARGVEGEGGGGGRQGRAAAAVVLMG